MGVVGDGAHPFVSLDHNRVHILARGNMSKPLTLARLEDLTLGAFAFLPRSETLDHLVRFLSTWSGSESVNLIS